MDIQNSIKDATLYGYFNKIEFYKPNAFKNSYDDISGLTLYIGIAINRCVELGNTEVVQYLLDLLISIYENNLRLDQQKFGYFKSETTITNDALKRCSIELSEKTIEIIKKLNPNHKSFLVALINEKPQSQVLNDKSPQDSESKPFTNVESPQFGKKKPKKSKKPKKPDKKDRIQKSKEKKKQKKKKESSEFDFF